MLEVTIHSVGTGDCQLSGKTAVDGMCITMKDGTVTSGFLSNKAFLQICKMKLAKNGKPAMPVAAIQPTLPLAVAK
jgi:hypothetical protein